MILIFSGFYLSHTSYNRLSQSLCTKHSLHNNYRLQLLALVWKFFWLLLWCFSPCEELSGFQLLPRRRGVRGPKGPINTFSDSTWWYMIRMWCCFQLFFGSSVLPQFSALSPSTSSHIGTVQKTCGSMLLWSMSNKWQAWKITHGSLVGFYSEASEGYQFVVGRAFRLVRCDYLLHLI